MSGVLLYGPEPLLTQDTEEFIVMDVDGGRAEGSCLWMLFKMSAAFLCDPDKLEN